jgi:hypothetical protein
MDKPETNVITFNYEKTFRDLGSGLKKIVRYALSLFKL